MIIISALPDKDGFEKNRVINAFLGASYSVTIKGDSYDNDRLNTLRAIEDLKAQGVQLRKDGVAFRRVEERCWLYGDCVDVEIACNDSGLLLFGRIGVKRIDLQSYASILTPERESQIYALFAQSGAAHTVFDTF